MNALTDLVGPGHVDRRVYVDPRIFDAEMTHIYGRAWLVLGHVSMVGAAGDYFTARMGREPVVAHRGDDGAVRIFYNRCPHRGATICAAGTGHARRLQCPYHGWTFGAAGQLLGVPARDEYDPAVWTGDTDLHAVARVEIYRGFIFASLATDGPDLRSFLGEAVSIIDEFVDHAPAGEVEAIRSTHRHSYRGNWKLQFENLNDTVHPAFSHASSISAAQAAVDAAGVDGLTPELRVMLANGLPISFFQQNRMVVTQHGHSYIDGHIGAAAASPLLAEYRGAMVAARGAAATDEILAHNRHLMLLYPGSTWQARFQTMKIIVPVAVDRTDTITYVFRLKGAPEAMLGLALPYANLANSAASPIIADDLELYERCMTGNGAGTPERVVMARGLGDRRSEHRATSEAYIRNQFASWSAYMAAA